MTWPCIRAIGLFALLVLPCSGCSLVTSFDDDRLAETTQAACSDGVDNDESGVLDCDEPGCDTMPNCRCNPVESSVPGCPTAFACDFRDSIVEGTKVSECRAAGTGIQGDACVFPEQCAAGFACVRLAANERVCARYCNLATAAPCNEIDGTICRALGMGITVHGASFGACLP